MALNHWLKQALGNRREITIDVVKKAEGLRNKAIADTIPYQYLEQAARAQQAAMRKQMEEMWRLNPYQALFGGLGLGIGGSLGQVFGTPRRCPCCGRWHLAEWME